LGISLRCIVLPYTTLFRSLLRKRYHQIELFLKFPSEVQDEVLRQLMDFSQDTLLGREYGFKDLPKYEEFRNRVPLVGYEDIAPLDRKSTRLNSSHVKISYA